MHPLPCPLSDIADECLSFGYDQGMMGGVNTSPHYVTTMDLGYITCVDHMSMTSLPSCVLTVSAIGMIMTWAMSPLSRTRQNRVVSLPVRSNLLSVIPYDVDMRVQFTISAVSLAPFPLASWVTKSAVLRRWLSYVNCICMLRWIIYLF